MWSFPVRVAAELLAEKALADEIEVNQTMEQPVGEVAKGLVSPLHLTAGIVRPKAQPVALDRMDDTHPRDGPSSRQGDIDAREMVLDVAVLPSARDSGS